MENFNNEENKWQKPIEDGEVVEEKKVEEIEKEEKFEEAKVEEETEKVEEEKEQEEQKEIKDEEEQEEIKEAEEVEENVAEAEEVFVVSEETERKYWGMDENTYVMALNLSRLLNYLTPGLGVILSIVMWVLYKDTSKKIDSSGKTIMNWMLTAFIGMIVAGLLTVTVVGSIIGIPLAIAIIICDLIFSVRGGIYANNDKSWKYPLTFKFFN